jgi:tight adherence protein B
MSVPAATVAALPVAAVGLLAWPTPARARGAVHRSLGDRSRRGGMAACGGLLVAALVVVAGPWVAGATLLAAVTVTYRVRATHANRRRTTAAHGLAEALRGMVGELRRGAHPALAAEAVADDCSPEIAVVLRTVVDCARIGGDVEPALRGVAATMPQLGEELRRLGAAWRLTSTHGVPLSDILQALHRDLDHRSRCVSSLYAQLAGARASAMVLAALPFAGIALGELIGAGPLKFLCGNGFGGVLLLIGVGLVCLGVQWSARLTERAVPR